MKKILLVEPNFPIPNKSKNHSYFLPIGLLKIGSYHRNKGDKVKLVRGLKRCGFTPNRILITSLFTYWSNYVHDAANYYHKTYPLAQIEIGGIYASLMPEHCKKGSPFAKVSQGLYMDGDVENVVLDYSLLPDPVDYQIIHTSRGCVRRCSFCGTWRIEPEFTYKSTIIPEIQKRKLVFYDNNLLANPDIGKILTELSNYRTDKGHRLRCESQSGFDLRFITEERALLLKAANFINPRIAWDGPYSDWKLVKKSVNILKRVGYGRRDIYIFMIYNNELSCAEIKSKLDACRRWSVRVIDCRYRPLEYTRDDYRPFVYQGEGDYYIHPGWTDKKVRRFRKSVRRQNIAILLKLPNNRYIPGCESRKVAS